MISQSTQLHSDTLDIAKLDQKPTRAGFGEGLVEAGDKDPTIVALCADLTESTMILPFKKKYPARFIEIGVAEQNLAGVAAGLAALGKLPVISSYAMFSPGRNWEQIRTTICYNEQPVIIVGSHAGVSVGPDGATHQAIEDMAITRVLPGMTVVSPCDMIEAKKAMLAAALLRKPLYLRLHREKSPVFTTANTPFEIGKAEVFFDSDGSACDVAIIATGPLVHNALMAASELEKAGKKVRVINCHTIKPLDEKTILDAARLAKRLVTVEEHQIAGGLGSAVAELTARVFPVPIEFVGVANRFGESGDKNELIEHFGMGVSHIVAAAGKVLTR
ncbi:MAG: transketolase C-terminal domain-containing protein [Patescibacteria group bacterium]